MIGCEDHFRLEGKCFQMLLDGAGQCFDVNGFRLVRRDDAHRWLEALFMSASKNLSFTVAVVVAEYCG